jgi:hypothetical protein
MILLLVFLLLPIGAQGIRKTFRYRPDNRRIGVRFPAASRQALGHIQPLIWRVPGAIRMGIKHPRSGTDHSPPFTDEIKYAWGFTSTPPHVTIAWCLIKHRYKLHLLPLPSIVRFTFYITQFPCSALFKASISNQQLTLCSELQTCC